MQNKEENEKPVHQLLAEDKFIPIPWFAYRFLGYKKFHIFGNHVGLYNEETGADTVDLGEKQDWRRVVQYLAEQFGGSVVWNDPKPVAPKKKTKAKK